jgi:hypothetical protein
MGISASTWNSLEIAKLIVAALTPILVAVAGFWINKRLKSVEAAQWTQQKIVERRIAAYDQLAPGLNQLFCYFSYVGPWKTMEPPSVVALKRTLDECAYVNAPLFDPEFLRRYNDMMDGCFMSFVTWGQDAKLRTHYGRRQKAMAKGWDKAWDACFADDSQATAPDLIKELYTSLMAYLAHSMGVTQVDAHMLGAGDLPTGYDVGA